MSVERGDEKTFKTTDIVGVYGDPTYDFLINQPGRILVADYPMPPEIGPGWTITWKAEGGKLRVWLIDLHPTPLN